MFFTKIKHRLKLVPIFCTLLLLVSACTPALNWRDVRMESAKESANSSSLKAALPCKPDAATRKQKLGETQVDLTMMGCIANDLTFTLSRIPLTDPLVANKVLAAWQTAAAANVKAKPALTKPANVSGASALLPAARITLEGTEVQAQIVWFAKQSEAAVTLYQAAVYAKQANNEAVATFFESLQVQ
jgi:hypothetical protein